MPEIRGETLGDVVEHLLRLDSAMTGCNEQLRAIREHVESVSQ